jgi:hypothetical protein
MPGSLMYAGSDVWLPIVCKGVQQISLHPVLQTFYAYRGYHAYIHLSHFSPLSSI